ncbi:DUF1801 domain-containing protein [Nitratireductor basaltis]|uniref:YdhG-like domain-containing protein n=1 Tax=Nitratireductor basaltis TaxID=472175 RepID=A0A084U863_9HYPH|nr:DUF1801 domain-containing protein [Nitratireductor basaltis]KFB09149.1 hypothetical protein EL18_00164 [Nitratireductor basaltis]
MSASEVEAEITRKFEALGGWRGAMLAHVRQLILTDPRITEAIKWRKPSNPSGVAVWEHEGIICTGESYKDKVKLTFAYGASLPDPQGLFNASLTAGTRRAIDLKEGAAVDPEAFRKLIADAADFNTRLKAAKA